MRMYFALLIIVFTSVSNLHADISEKYLYRNIADFELSHTGEHLLIAPLGGDIFITDLQGQTLNVPLIGTSLRGVINQMAWSMDDEIVVIGFSSGVGVWGSNSGEQLYFSSPYPSEQATAFSDTSVDNVAISTDNRFIATSNRYDPTVFLHHLVEKSIIQPLNNLLPSGEFTSVDELAFNADGSLLAVTYFVGGVGIWDTRRYERLNILKGEQAVFSPDGVNIATVEGRLVSDIYVWEAASGSLIQHNKSPLMVGQMAWSGDNLSLYALFTSSLLVQHSETYAGQGVKRWFLNEDEAELFSSPQTFDLAVSLGDSEVLISFNDHDVLVWSRTDDRVYRMPMNLNTTNAYSLSTEPIYAFEVDKPCSLLIGARAEDILFWDLASNQLIETLSVDSTPVKFKISQRHHQILVLGLQNDVRKIDYRHLCVGG